MIPELTVSARPVSIAAPPTIKRAAIVITIGLENPAKASSGVSILNKVNPTTTPSATKSDDSHSVINRRIAPANIPNVTQAANVIELLIT
jgi:hypothetical protein